MAANVSGVPPGREPNGYWQMLQAKQPEPIIAPGARTKMEWIKAGQIVFREKDVPPFRNYEAAIIATVRSPEAFAKAGGIAQPDGTVVGMRWVPTSKGVALSILDCGGCHTRLMPDGSYVDGAPPNLPGNRVFGQLIAAESSATGDESPAIKAWRQFAVPWIADDIHSSIKSMQPPELAGLLGSGVKGTFARFNGSPYYTTKIPDLIGIGDQRYIDHTATHRLRDAGDVARYAALVTCCDIAEFGAHRMQPENLRDVRSAIRMISYLRLPNISFPSSRHRIRIATIPEPPQAGESSILRAAAAVTLHRFTQITNSRLPPATRPRKVIHSLPASCPCRSERIQGLHSRPARALASTRCRR